MSNEADRGEFVDPASRRQMERGATEIWKCPGCGWHFSAASGTPEAMLKCLLCGRALEPLTPGEDTGKDGPVATPGDDPR